MKKNLVVFSSALMIFAFLLSACGGGAPAKATEVPAKATEPPAKATEAPNATEAPARAASAFYLEIADIKGTVEVRANADADYVPAKVGQRLHEGAQVRTGADGVVIFYRDRLNMALLDKNTELEIKTLQGTPEAPVTELLLLNGSVFIQRLTEEIPAGFVFAVVMNDGNTGGIFGSDIAAINNGPKVSAIFQPDALFDLRVNKNPPGILASSIGFIDAMNGGRGGGPMPTSERSEEPTPTSPNGGEQISNNEFICVNEPCEVKNDEQTLTLKQGQVLEVKGSEPFPQPVEMGIEEENQLLTMANEACGCKLSLEDIQNGELAEKMPAPDDVNEEQQPEDNSGGNDNSGGGNDNSNGGNDNGGGDDNSGGGNSSP